MTGTKSGAALVVAMQQATTAEAVRAAWAELSRRFPTLAESYGGVLAESAQRGVAAAVFQLAAARRLPVRYVVNGVAVFSGQVETLSGRWVSVRQADGGMDEVLGGHLEVLASGCTEGARA